MSALEFSQLLGNCGEALTELEEERMFLWNIAIWRQQQTIFFQAQDGLLDVQTTDEQSAIIKNLLQPQSARRYWANYRHTFDSRFVAWVNDAISSAQAGSGE